MNYDIDIVVTYVKPTPLWVELKDKYYNLENSVEVKNNDFNGESRYRDINLLKYWFRSTIKNCPWLHKIFLVVQDEDQVPEWLNLSCPKLRVVYHREFIPEELLPTFNSNCIELHLHKISDLSEHYILCNDDTYFLNPIDKNKFFDTSGRPNYELKMHSGKWHAGNNLFYKTLNNNLRLEHKYIDVNYYYSNPHLQDARLKSFETHIYNKHEKDILDSLRPSRFRHSSNYTQYLYSDLLKMLKKGNRSNIYLRSKSIAFVNFKSDTYNRIFTYEMVCLNDTSSTRNFEDIKTKLRNEFSKRYDTPCIFEKKLRVYILKKKSLGKIDFDNNYLNLIISKNKLNEKYCRVFKDIDKITYQDIVNIGSNFIWNLS